MAQKLTKAVPKLPHLTHMPGHLHFLAGDYEQAVSVFENARQQELRYHTTEKIPVGASQNYIHNLHFLALAYAELGNKAKALDIAGQLAATTLSIELPNEGAALMLLYEGRILPALVHMRFREWEKADQKLAFWLNTPDAPLTNNLVRLYLQAMQAYCRGMQEICSEGEVTSGPTMAVREQRASENGMQLTRLLRAFEQEGSLKQGTPDYKAINETHDIISMARYELAGWIDNMDKTKPFSDAAWNEAISLQNAIRYDEPPRLMYPVEESLARLHQYRSESRQAEQAIAHALLKRPKSAVITQLKKQ